jgi:hypothetical protein
MAIAGGGAPSGLDLSGQSSGPIFYFCCEKLGRAWVDCRDRRELVVCGNFFEEAAMVDETKAEERRRGPRGPYRRRLSQKLELALEAIASRKVATLAEAAELSGQTARNLTYAMHKPHVKAWLRERVASLLGLGQTAAAETMLSLLRSENSMTQFRSASWLLGLAGFAPADTRGPMVSINVDASPGYIIDLSSDNPRPSPDGNVVRFPAGPVIDGECEDVTPVASED